MASQRQEQVNAASFHETNGRLTNEIFAKSPLRFIIGIQLG